MRRRSPRYNRAAGVVGRRYLKAGWRGDEVAEGLGMIDAKLMMHCEIEVRVLDDNGYTMNAKSLYTMVSCRSL